jgi:hypothetical protein
VDEQQKLAVFQAQTENVRELERAWAHVNRQINDQILRKNSKAVETTTKLLALIYCALAEAVFSKLIHTPYGLEIAEIEQAKAVVSSDGIKSAWLKCAEFSVRYVGGKKSNHVPNVLQTLTDLIDRFIFDPSLLRNKLAHGQWSVALNRQNTAVNHDITREIKDLTVVELYKKKYALQKLALILEDIIESPNKTHYRDYRSHLTQLEAKEREMARWTFKRKVDQLFDKKSREPMSADLAGETDVQNP